ncbi:MAG: pyrroloquinoline quinone precursor peptide PqqA [Gemmatimonadales bacterium]
METPKLSRAHMAHLLAPWEITMTWTKPEAEIVAVTMEVTAYVATL